MQAVPPASAARRWREQLADWAIPEHILAGVEESPWVVPAEHFARRADRFVQTPHGASWQQALAAIAPRGTVLDVGAGAGAASLPLAAYLDELIAVDVNGDMLGHLSQRAQRLGVPARTIVGRWPDVADQAPTVDVVTCYHVLYNVPDLPAFAAALTAHARRRVVVELTQQHPLAVLNPLWLVLQGVTRPTRPTADDAAAVLREIGISPYAQSWRPTPQAGGGSFDGLVAQTRRQLCLPESRTDELIAALAELGVDHEHPDRLGADRELVTLWWDPA